MPIGRLDVLRAQNTSGLFFRAAPRWTYHKFFIGTDCTVLVRRTVPATMPRIFIQEISLLPAEFVQYSTVLGGEGARVYYSSVCARS